MAIGIPQLQIHHIISKPLPLQHPRPPRPCIVLALPRCSLLRLQRPASLYRRAATGTTQTPLVTRATLLLKGGRRHPGEALTITIPHCLGKNNTGQLLHVHAVHDLKTNTKSIKNSLHTRARFSCSVFGPGRSPAPRPETRKEHPRDKDLPVLRPKHFAADLGVIRCHQVS